MDSERWSTLSLLLDELIERQLRHADLALGRQPEGMLRPSVTQYSLDMLNVETRHELPRIVAALKVRGHGALCFHGAPGTGKILINGGAAHLIKAGERVTIMAFGYTETPPVPKILLLDARNQILREGR